MNEILLVNDIINTIPMLLEYLVPGYVFLLIRNFSLSKDETKDKYLFFKSIVVSYIFLHTIYPVVLCILSKMNIGSDAIRNIYLVSIIVFSIAYNKMKCEKFLLTKLGNGKTTKEDCFDVILEDYPEGVLVMAYLEDEELIYTGSLVYYDDKYSSDDRKIVLAGYTLNNYDAELIYDYEGNEKNVVVLSMKDVKRIEIFR